MIKKWEITKDGFIVLTDSTGHKCNYSSIIFRHVAVSSGGNYFKNTYNLSQEEIDALVSELDLYKPKEEQLEFQMAEGFNWQETKPKDNLCIHEWVEYLGLNESFLHCKLCGAKKV